MTLEEIKAEIESRQKSCIEIINGGYGNTAYERGCHNTYGEVLELLEDLEPSWHPYPQEKPTEDSLVLVQFDDGHMETQHFIYDDFLWDGNCVRIPVAWMELPKPYKKESNNDH